MTEARKPENTVVQTSGTAIPKNALYLIRNTALAPWARYEIGCGECEWWAFTDSRLKGFWRLYRHDCGRVS